MFAEGLEVEDFLIGVENLDVIFWPGNGGFGDVPVFRGFVCIGVYDMGGRYLNLERIVWLWRFILGVGWRAQSSTVRI